MPSVAVLFDRFGPYHVARLRGAAACLDATGIETFREDAIYAWDQVSHGDGSGFRRVSLFDSQAQASETSELRRRMHRALDDLRPDAVAVQGWASAGALAGLEWCNRNAIPAVVMSESTSWDFERNPLKEAVKRSVLSLASAGLAGGRPHAEYLEQLGMPKERVFTGYDVVDNAYFVRESDAARADPDGRRKKLGLPELYFVASARFIEKKNLPGLVRAYAAYQREAADPPWHLVILGDGPLRGRIEAERDRFGLGDSVQLPGFKQYGDLPACLGLAGAFVHASTREQWGLVVNEAMACALPVLVSNLCGCASDLVDDGRNGFTFDPLSEPDLTQAMLAVTSDDTRRKAMGNASRAIVRNWSPEVFGRNLKAAVEAGRSLPQPRGSVLGRCLVSLLLKKHARLQLYDPD